MVNMSDLNSRSQCRVLDGIFLRAYFWSSCCVIRIDAVLHPAVAHTLINSRIKDSVMRWIVLALVVAVVIVSAYYGSLVTQVEPVTSDAPVTQVEPVFVEGYSVTVITDKQEYEIGETVRYSIINTGTVEASFRNIAYGLVIEDLYGNHVSSPATGQLEVRLQPDERADGSWYLDYYGNVIPPGPYVIAVDGAKSEPFTIYGEPPFFDLTSINE